jgi:hypothetical protein
MFRKHVGVCKWDITPIDDDESVTLGVPNGQPSLSPLARSFLHRAPPAKELHLIQGCLKLIRSSDFNFASYTAFDTSRFYHVSFPL